MKSHSDSLLQIAVGLCKDVQLAYPELRGVDRDIARLTLLVESRGLGVFTLDLPARESALLAGLESGLLCSKGTQVYSKRYRVPRLFAGLYMRIFDRQLRLKVDADVNAICFLRQLLVLGKKTEVPCSLEREQKAIEEYIHVEQTTVRPTLGWTSDSLGIEGGIDDLHLLDAEGPDLPLFPAGFSGRQKLLLQRCQRVADYVAQMLGVYCPDCFLEENRLDNRPLGLRHGPGAVAERGGKYFDKYRFSNWPAKLGTMFPFSSYGKMPNDDRDQPLNHEVPARLICVPKTAKGPRIIAAEPSEHMFVQKLLATWLERRIKDTVLGKFIDFRDQRKSGRMVIKASLDRSLATIDLSSASDRLSLYVVERIFRSNPSFLKALHASRTRWIRLPNGECMELKKFASQGTAITFPVQTLVFFVIAMAVATDGDVSERGFRRCVGKVRIFGDDIILPNTGFAEIVDLLHMLNLKVNVEKSFSCGYFRESCGVDAFKGYDITPVKPETTISDSPAQELAALDACNNLFYKGYWNASEAIRNRQRSRSEFNYGIVGPYAGATGYVSYSFGTIARKLHEAAVSSLGNAVRTSNGCSRSGSQGQRGSEFVYQTRSLWFTRFENQVRAVLPGLGRLRWNMELHRIECRSKSIRQTATVRDYDCGYSGLLDAQLRPRSQGTLASLGIRGVPERPRSVKAARWESFEHLFDRRVWG